MKKMPETWNRKLDTLIPWVFSFIGALAGVFCGAAIGILLARTGTIPAVIGNGLFFLLVFSGGCLGLRLGLKIRHIRIELPGKHRMTAILCAMLIFVAGAAGQCLFMMDTEDYTIRTGGDTVDLVLLLDGSSSMDSLGYQEARNDAAAEFIESLNEDTMLQVIGYHGGIISAYTSYLLEMTDDNKEALVDLVRDMDSVGTTNYNTALSAALETLTGSDAREDSVKAVILLTDGFEGDLDSDTISSFEASGAMLFTVRITTSGSDTQIRDLIDLAESSGGFDLALMPDASGDISSGDLSEAFADAFAEASEFSGKKLVFSGTIMLYDEHEEDLTLWQILVRFVTILLCMIAASLVYYGRTDRHSLGKNAVCALLLSVLLIILGDSFLFLRMLPIALLLGTAFVSMEITEIPEDDGETGSGDGPGRQADRGQGDVSEDPLPEEDIFYV